MSHLVWKEDGANDAHRFAQPRELLELSPTYEPRRSAVRLDDLICNTPRSQSHTCNKYKYIEGRSTTKQEARGGHGAVEMRGMQARTCHEYAHVVV